MQKILYYLLSIQLNENFNGIKLLHNKKKMNLSDKNLLDLINSPKDLKKMSIEDLDKSCP